MKALVKKFSTPGIWLEEIPMPVIKDDEVLIKVKKASLCGTDIHIYRWDAWAQKNVPLNTVIGHEFMGIVTKVGPHVKHVKEGDRVSGEGHVVCGECINCQDEKKHLCLHTEGIGVKRFGCFSEYFPLPGENVFHLPESISDELGSILDPFGNAVHTALSFSLVGEDVLITGAGPIGIMAAMIAQKAGARHAILTDRNEYRLELARKMGVLEVINIDKERVQEAMKVLHVHDGFSVGLEMSGNSLALKTLLETARPGGKIALLGILPPGCDIDWDLVIFKMLTIKGIYGREIFSTWHKMVSFLEGGLNLKPLITHRFPFHRFQEAFDLMASQESGKIVLDWS